MKILGLGFTYLAQENSVYGARFKSFAGGKGSARKYDHERCPLKATDKFCRLVSHGGASR